jgi:hypothetical protein
MKNLVLAVLVLLLWPGPPARAQTATPVAPAVPAIDEPDGEVVEKPVCFNVVNKAPYTVIGTLSTNVFKTPEGIAARHRGNFRLETGQKTNFCSLGPFYAGRKLDLVLRSLVPLFSCRTAITGDIVIYGRKKEEGGTDTWAACL